MSSTKTYGLDPDTRTWVNNVQANYGSVSYGTVQAVDNFVGNLKDNGIWGSIVDMGVFVGDNFAAAQTKLKYPAGISPFLISGGGFAGNFYTERGIAGGVSGNGAGYLDTSIPQSMFLPQNRHMSVYCNGQFPANNARLMGSDVTSNTNIWSICYNNPSSTLSYNCAISVASIDFTNMTTGGHYVGIGSQLPNAFYVNAQGTGNSSSVTISPCTGSTTQYILALNRNGTAVAATASRIAFYSIGLALSPSQVTGFYAAVQGLQTTLGRNV